MIQACTYHSAMFVKPQQWPTPSESIAIYCVRKLVSCITHLQSCAKVDIWNKKKKLRTVAKIKTQNYKIWRLPKFSTIAAPPLNTATTLFNEPRSQRPFGTSDRLTTHLQNITSKSDTCKISQTTLAKYHIEIRLFSDNFLEKKGKLELRVICHVDPCERQVLQAVTYGVYTQVSLLSLEHKGIQRKKHEGKIKTQEARKTLCNKTYVF